MTSKMILKKAERMVASEVPNDDLTGMEFIEELVVPIMLAIGYHPVTVYESLSEVGDMNLPEVKGEDIDGESTIIEE